MSQPKHYVFHANACGVAARIRRPADLTLPAHGAVSLPLTGGVSEINHGAVRWDEGRAPSEAPYIAFDAVHSRVHGDYEDTARAVAMTRGEVPVETLAAATRVHSEIANLHVLGRVKVARAVMTLQAHSADGEPSIRCDGSTLEGVEVDGHPIRITLATAFFTQHDTLTGLGAAARAGHNRQCFFDAGPSAIHGFIHPNGLGKATLVTGIEWEGRAHPDAAIEGHAIRIPDFGRVYFAELFVTAASRRLTMLRFQLGSPVGGEVCAASGDTNGSQWPPTGG